MWEAGACRRHSTSCPTTLRGASTRSRSSTDTRHPRGRSCSPSRANGKWLRPKRTSGPCWQPCARSVARPPGWGWAEAPRSTASPRTSSGAWACLLELALLHRRRQRQLFAIDGGVEEVVDVHLAQRTRPRIPRDDVEDVGASRVVGAQAPCLQVRLDVLRERPGLAPGHVDAVTRDRGLGIEIEVVHFSFALNCVNFQPSPSVAPRTSHPRISPGLSNGTTNTVSRPQIPVAQPAPARLDVTTPSTNPANTPNASSRMSEYANMR